MIPAKRECHERIGAGGLGALWVTHPQLPQLKQHCKGLVQLGERW